MLQISDLTFRMMGRPLFEGASAVIPEGMKVGLVGRNGTGKTTLFKIITGDLVPESGSTELPKGLRIGQVAQEAPGTEPRGHSRCRRKPRSTSRPRRRRSSTTTAPPSVSFPTAAPPA